MRPLLLLLVLLPLAIGGIASFAWVRAGQDRYAALEEEGMALARVLRGAATEAALNVRSAEANLAGRLAAVARHADQTIASTREPAAELLAAAAEQGEVGQIFLFDHVGAPIAFAQWPAPVDSGRDGVLSAKRKATLQWRDAKAALASKAPAPNEVIVEGLRSNVFATRERFGVIYGRADGGKLLLRASAEELSTLRHRFGLDPLLEHFAEVPSVDAVRIWGGDGAPRLSRGTLPADEASPGLPAELADAGQVELDGAHVRALLPVTTAVEGLVVEVRLSRAGADAAVAATRRSILLGALLALALALGAGTVLLVREAAMRRATAEADAKQKEERRLAEMGALASLVTHEVNNPLNSLRLALGVLEGLPPDADRGAVHATMKDEIARMSRTLDGYMALAGTDRRTKQRVGPALLETLRARVATEARERGVTLAFSAADDAPAVLGDPVVLEQALANLVRNALQACPAGGTVTVRWEREAPASALLSVTDTGPGLPTDRAALLRLGGLHRADGHGLGLPLTKRFVETHGGRLGLEDGPEGGARVTVRLPAAEDETPDA